jgi:hypothetical protein
MSYAGEETGSPYAPYPSNFPGQIDAPQREFEFAPGPSQPPHLSIPVESQVPTIPEALDTWIYDTDYTWDSFPQDHPYPSSSGTPFDLSTEDYDYARVPRCALPYGPLTMSEFQVFPLPGDTDEDNKAAAFLGLVDLANFELGKLPWVPDTSNVGYSS